MPASSPAMTHLQKSTLHRKEFRDKNYLYHRAADYQYDTTLLTLPRKPEVRS